MPDLISTPDFDQRLIAYRRDFHKYPEPAWLEYRTTVKIIRYLQELGLEPKWGREIHTPELMMGKPTPEKDAQWRARATTETGCPDLIEAMSGGYTGVIVEVEGGLPGPTVAMRVDIDSNDLEESDGPEHRPVAEGFSSVHPGAMHSCGHDGHTAIGLGTVELLVRNRQALRGKAIMIFQAAEEGGRGASSLVGTGLFSDVDYFFSGHIGINKAPVGTVSASTYGFMSGTKFDVTFTGLAAHAGVNPDIGHNALAAASNAVLNMLAIPRSGKGISRVNIGMISGGTGRNVIPDKVTICAEARGENREVSDYMFESAMRVCKASADMYQCEVSHIITGKSEGAECDMDFAGQVAGWAKGLEGITDVPLESNIGAGENVTFMMNDVQRRGGKTTFMLLGGGIKESHHSKRFDFDERVIPLGARLFAKLVFDIGSSAER